MKILISLFICPLLLFSQSLIFVNDFGKFENAASFDIDLSGNYFIADLVTNTISKIDSTGKLLFNIGGFGWDASQFDEPIDVVTNTLSLYVADKNNNRIQRFDKDLNFLSEYSGTNPDNEIEFGYPTCIDISGIGDLYLLDSDNNRILKFNLIGEYLQEIGGNDAGSFAISNPKNFTVDELSNLFILDDETIKVFDQYGNGKFYFKPDFAADKINVDNGNLIYINTSQVNIFNINERKPIHKFENFPNLEDEKIVDVIIKGKSLFLLTQNRIIKYLISK